jgi:hypothetical protein
LVVLAVSVLLLLLPAHRFSVVVVVVVRTMLEPLALVVTVAVGPVRQTVALPMELRTLVVAVVVPYRLALILLERVVRVL